MSVRIVLDTKELDRLIHDTGRDMRYIMVDLALQMEGKAKQNSPVKTGAMKNSIYTEVMQTGDVAARVGPTVEYALYVHEGTSRMAARPFLRDAAEMIGRRLNSGALWRRLFK